MKIITWNCNMAFRKKWSSIIKLKPDLLIIQECENESKYKPAEIIPDYNQFIWIGENPNKGVGVISFNNYHIEISENYNDQYKYILPLKVTGAATFNLFAIWAMPHPKSRAKGYVGQIWDAMNYYKSTLKKPAVLIGDWNSNVFWDHLRKKGNHTHLVNLLKEFGIVSVYHELNNIEHGDEKEPTLYLLKNKKKPYHIDYCFASKKFINNQTTIEIGTYKKWIKTSDHMPLVIDNLVNLK